jgi:hypothetical protein
MECEMVVLMLPEVALAVLSHLADPLDLLRAGAACRLFSLA